ncbi:hypothetical protein PAPYR_11771 [Paratrimastix pyriformis]|uniref:Uncharacterized protein n=1 Tax=Paratrimastix pyriformis TaxID=342808 RepID=A0ABQ8U777_9EUKA|nr:hypothetical protein PAPYR_11771 [Paratrimastix pyriformis]
MQTLWQRWYLFVGVVGCASPPAWAAISQAAAQKDWADTFFASDLENLSESTISFSTKMTSHEMARQRDAIKKEMNWMFRWNADDRANWRNRCLLHQTRMKCFALVEPKPLLHPVLFQTVQERFPEGPALTSHEYGWKRPDPEITPPRGAVGGTPLSGTRLTAQESPSHFGALVLQRPGYCITPRPTTPPRDPDGSVLDDLPCYVALDDVRRCNRQIALLAARRECDLRATAEREGLDIQTTLVRLLDSVGLPLECPLIAPPAELVAGFASADF